MFWDTYRTFCLADLIFGNLRETRILKMYLEVVMAGISKGKQRKKPQAKALPQTADRGSSCMVNFILDESGSMQEYKAETVKAFNKFVDDHRKIESLTMSLVKFNSRKIDFVYKDMPLPNVPRLDNDTYAPNNETPLYDAIGQAIRSMSEIRKALVVVMTDGQENASREYTQDQIFNFIQGNKNEGWSFVYLGANQDAWAVAQGMGFSRDKVSSYAMQNMKEVFETLSLRSREFLDRGARRDDKFFDDGDEKRLTS